MKFKAYTLVGLAIVIAQQAQAQTTVEKGKTVGVEIPVSTESACNIEVTRGNEKTNVRVEANSTKGIYQFAGRELGEETIRWEGKIKFRGLKTLGPCRGDGALRVVTVESAETRAAAKQALEAQEAANQAKAAMAAQAARLAELEARLKAAEAESAKTPEQKAAEARVAAEAKAYAEAKVASEAKAAADQRALEQAQRAAEAKAVAQARAEAEAAAAAKAKAKRDAIAQAEKAKAALLNHVFSKKWQVAGLPCNLNGGAYQIFSRKLKVGWNMAAGGKLLKQTGNNARFSFEVLNERTFRHVMTIYAGGNRLVTRALGNPNARISYSVDEYTLIDKDTMRKTVRDQRKLNFDLMMKGVYRLDTGPDKGKTRTVKACK